MENYLRASGENQTLSDQALRALYLEQIETFTQPERLSFTQVFVSQDRHGTQSLEKVEQLLAEFNDNGFSLEGAVSQGDPFIQVIDSIKSPSSKSRENSVPGSVTKFLPAP